MLSYSFQYSPEVLLARFSLHMHKGGLKPHLFNFVAGAHGFFCSDIQVSVTEMKRVRSQTKRAGISFSEFEDNHKEAPPPRWFERKKYILHPLVKLSILGSLRDREAACSASDLQGLNFDSRVWRAVSSHSSHHPQEFLLAQFSLYVHKSALKSD